MLSIKAKLIALVIFITVGGLAWWHWSNHAKTSLANQAVAETGAKPPDKNVKPKPKKAVHKTVKITAATKPAAISATSENASCSNNTHTKEVIVSLNQQHLWACSGTKQVYVSAVTTGAYKIGDGTPTGTWQIYSKQVNQYLTGPGYRDFVKYWMPFYGEYGFHDSSWQTFPYGDLQKYGTQGSHGCVHLPAATAAWLYGWAQIGTTVTIEA